MLYKCDWNFAKVITNKTSIRSDMTRYSPIQLLAKLHEFNLLPQLETILGFYLLQFTAAVI